MKHLAFYQLIHRSRAIASQSSPGLLAVGFVFLVFLSPAVASSAEWPCYGADSGRTFVTSASISFPLAPSWISRPPQPPRPAWPEPGKELHRLDFDYCFEPVISEGLVLFGSSADDSLRALDLQSGKLRWRFVTGGPIRFAPAVEGGLCYVASDDGSLYCLELQNGQLKWKFRGGPDGRMVIGNGRLISRRPLRSGVLVQNGIVYFSAGMWPSEGVFLHALEAKTGKVVWTNDTCGLKYVDTAHSPASALGGVAPQGYLVASRGVLLVPTGRSTPAGFDLKTGKLLYCNPEVHRHWWPGGTRTTATAGYFFNPCTQGTFSSSHATSEPADPVLFDGTHVYDIKTGHHASQRFLPYTFHHSNPYYRTLAQGEDLFTVEPGWIRRVNMHDPLSRSVRREVWKSQFEGSRAHSIVWIGQHLIVGDEGAIHVYEAETGKKAWRAHVDGTVRGLAAAEGRLIVSTEEGEIQCWTPGKAKTVPLREEVPSFETASANREARWVLDSLGDIKRHPGFAVVVENEDLAVHLVRQTKLQVTLIVESAEVCNRIRERLFDEGQSYGHRLTILPKNRLKDLPPYFANVVVSPQVSKMPFQELHRILHPYSGQWVLPGHGSDIVAEDRLFAKGPELRWKTSAGGLLGIAGAIPATHRAVQGPFEMLWFGGPGPMRMSDRHIVNGPRPRAAGGRTFVVGAHHVMAFDAFNGSELWSLPLRDACVRDREVRSSSQNVFTAGISYAVDDNTVRLNLGDDVHLDLDPASGEPRRYYGAGVATTRYSLAKPRTFLIPQQDEAGGKNAVNAGTWGSVELNSTKEALEVVLTAHHPEGRLLDRWDVFCDFRKPDEQFGLYEKGAFQFTIYPETDYDQSAVNVFYKYFPRWMGRVPRPDPGETGTRAAEAFPGAGPIHPPIHVKGTRETKSSITRIRIAWADVRKLTGFEPSQFGFAAALLLDDPAAEPIERTRLFGGASAPRINNGWPIFDLDAETDAEIHSPVQTELLAPVTEMPEIQDHAPAEKDVAYENSPPYRIHPLTRRPTRRLFRPAYGCASPISGDNTAFFRSGSIAYYDYQDDTGVRNIFGIRPGCLYNSSILPAMGLVLYAERSSGCACNYNFQTSFALVPTDRRRNEDWAVYYDKPAERPVRTMNLNFGVPGDRRDAEQELWLAYPRPSSRNRPALEVPVEVETFDGAEPYHFNSDFHTIHKTKQPWIYASGYRGIRRITIQTWPVTNAVAPRVSAPKIDGKLTESCWDQTNKQEMLPLRFDTPSPYYREYWDGMRSSERQTDWAFLRSDEKHLYAAFFDTPVPDRRGKLRPWRANAKDRDSVRTFGDNFYALAVTDDRKETLLLFAVSASGAVYDARSESLREQDVNEKWDGKWSSGVMADEKGFVSEFGIPPKTLADAGLNPRTLRVNLFAKTDSGAYGIRSTLPPGQFGIKRCQEFLPLGLGQPRNPEERTFRLRFHFAEPDAIRPGTRRFDIKIQGRTVLKDLDVLQEAGAINTALIKEITGVKASETLTIEFVPKTTPLTATTLPILSGLELLDESWQSASSHEQK